MTLSEAIQELQWIENGTGGDWSSLPVVTRWRWDQGYSGAAGDIVGIERVGDEVVIAIERREGR